MRVERRDTQFRVIAQAFSPVWLEDPPSHRKALVVLLRSLQDESGTGLFPYEQLAVLVGSSNRQAAHGHVQGVEESGGDLRGFLERKRKASPLRLSRTVDGEVVVVGVEWEADLWVGMEALAQGVNVRLGWEDLTASNMVTALDQMPGRKVRRMFLRVVVRGEAHYKEAYGLDRLLGWVVCGSFGKEGWGVTEEGLGALEQATEPIGEEVALGDAEEQFKEQ